MFKLCKASLNLFTFIPFNLSRISILHCCIEINKLTFKCTFKYVVDQSFK